MCEALHHKVLDLKRIRIMNIFLGNIKEGEYRLIDGKELEIFLELLKLSKGQK
jgi:23S rRNA pseudouridine2604 synthase